jgi:hypothetical protein
MLRLFSLLCALCALCVLSRPIPSLAMSAPDYDQSQALAELHDTAADARAVTMVVAGIVATNTPVSVSTGAVTALNRQLRQEAQLHLALRNASSISKHFSKYRQGNRGDRERGVPRAPICFGTYCTAKFYTIAMVRIG